MRKKNKSAKKLNTRNQASQLANKREIRNKRKADKYRNKNERAMTVPKKMSENELNLYKDKLQDIFSEVNHKIEIIQMNGLTSNAISRLLDESGRDYFDVDVIDSRETLIKELTRMNVFLADRGSTLEGARLDTAMINSEQYKGKFGNQYNNEENDFKRFDTRYIDEDVAKRAFSSYRRIEEFRASEITSEGAYGSENLITAMYDAEIRGLDSEVYGNDLLDAYYNEKLANFTELEDEFKEIKGITGLIYDNITRGYNF